MGNLYKLPDRTEQSLTRHIAGCKNLSLIMDKYPPWEVVLIQKTKAPGYNGLSGRGTLIRPLHKQYTTVGAPR